MFLAGERLRFKKLVVSKIIPIFAKKDIDICRKYLDSLDSHFSFTVVNTNLFTCTLKGTVEGAL